MRKLRPIHFLKKRFRVEVRPQASTWRQKTDSQRTEAATKDGVTTAKLRYYSQIQEKSHDVCGQYSKPSVYLNVSQHKESLVILVMCEQ